MKKKLKSKITVCVQVKQGTKSSGYRQIENMTKGTKKDEDKQRGVRSQTTLTVYTEPSKCVRKELIRVN